MQHKKIFLKLSTIERIRGHRSTPLIHNIAAVLCLKPDGVTRLLKSNTPNGLLTTIASLDLISHALDLPMFDLIETELL